MVRVSYERYQMDHLSGGNWEIIQKDFPNTTQADLFINRIRDNVIVGRIWKSSI